MVVKSRREEYAEATRAAVVEAAIDRFTAEGYAKVSIDSVAHQARVTKGAVYHHFADKAALFEAAYLHLEDLLLAEVLDATAGTEDPFEAIAVGATIFLTSCREPRFATIALAEAPVALGWARWKATEERYFLGLLDASLLIAVEQGLATLPAPSRLVATMLLGALDDAGLAVANSPDPHRTFDDALASFLWLLGSLRSEGGPPVAAPRRGRGSAGTRSRSTTPSTTAPPR